MSLAPFRFLLRPIRGAALAASVVMVGVAVGCSSNSPAVPQVFLQSAIDDGNNPAVGCGIVESSGGWVDIGSVSGSIADGSSQTGAAVSVSCSVTSNGDGSFNVSAAATLAGENGGSVTIEGKFTSSGTQSPIIAHFQRGDTGSFEENDCTATYNTALNVNMGVAGGRVWAVLECPTITKSDSSPPRVCEGTAQFRFENCTGS